MAEPMSVVLHVGAHKTATTHLQYNIRAHRKLLRKNGIAYYGPRDLRSPKLDIRGRLGIGRRSDEDAAEVFKQLRGKASRLILSDENWIAKAHPPSLPPDAPLYPRSTQYLSHLAKVAPSVSFDLFLSVRDYAPFYQSLYSQMFYGGEFISLDAYQAQFNYDLINWLAPVVALSGLSNVRSLTVWRYEDYRALAPTILDVMLGPQMGQNVVLEEGVRHGGLSQRAAAELLRMPAQNTIKSIGMDKKLRRSIAAEVAAKFPASAKYPKISIWTQAERTASTERYQQDLAQIAQLPKVTVLSV